MVPLPINAKTILILTPQYEQWRYGSEAAEQSDANVVHGLGLSVSLRYSLNQEWAVLGSVGMGIATDFEDVDTGHLRNTGALIASWRANATLVLGFGAAANYHFGEFLPVPLGILDWRPTEKWHIAATLPQFLKVGYRIHPGLEISVTTDISGNRFSIQNETIAENLAISQGSARLQLSTRVTGPFWLSLYAGHTFLRRLQIFDDNDEKLTDFDLEQSPLFGLSLQFLIQAPKQ